MLTLQNQKDICLKSEKRVKSNFKNKSKGREKLEGDEAPTTWRPKDNTHHKKKRRLHNLDRFE